MDSIEVEDSVGTYKPSTRRSLEKESCAKREPVSERAQN